MGVVLLKKNKTFLKPSTKGGLFGKELQIKITYELLFSIQVFQRLEIKPYFTFPRFGRYTVSLLYKSSQFQVSKSTCIGIENALVSIQK